jgi:hypothetical protein
MFIIIAAFAYWLIRFVVICVRPKLARMNKAPAMTMLKIPAPAVSASQLSKAERIAPVPAVVVPDTLCYECLYAHIVRGYDRNNEELVACGYVFPMREVPFRVHECSDYRPKRERNRVEKANEGAVCILPLDEKADEVHAVAAKRNGEGELESSYE